MLSSVLLKVKSFMGYDAVSLESSSRRFDEFQRLLVQGEAFLLLDSFLEGDVTATSKRRETL
jgi:hypothetical protein